MVNASAASLTSFTSGGSTAFFTIDRAQSGNAMTWAMYDALVEACERVDAEAGRLRVFVIRANGGVFSTGTDISQFTTFASGEDGLEYERRLERCLARIEQVSVPTIAQVEGIAAGAGCAIALACDLRVCTPAARFGVPIARTLGNGLSIENCARLVEHLGMARTKDLLLTGRLMDAAEAEASGIVTRMAEPAGIGAAVDDLANAIARNAPITLAVMKASLRRLSLRQRLEMEGIADLVASCYASGDFREGVSAFLAKRPPKFTGR
jgi:enoyl-CoA hydratase